MKKGQRPQRHIRNVLYGRNHSFKRPKLINPNIRKITNKQYRTIIRKIIRKEGKETPEDLMPYSDADRDKVPNWKDCRPFDRKRQDENITAEEFVEQRNKTYDPYRRITYHSPQELRNKNARLYLTDDKQGGVGVTPDGEIINLFSLSKGSGKIALRYAIENMGGTHLDCLDKEPGEERGLPDYYRQFGFREVRREKNYEEGKPDVVFMEL